MRFKPFLGTHEGVHARITDLTTPGNTNGPIWHSFGVQEGRIGLLRPMTFATVNFTCCARLFVPGVLLLKKATQVAAMDKILFCAENPL